MDCWLGEEWMMVVMTIIHLSAAPKGRIKKIKFSMTVGGGRETFPSFFFFSKKGLKTLDLVAIVNKFPFFRGGGLSGKMKNSFFTPFPFPLEGSLTVIERWLAGTR